MGSVYFALAAVELPTAWLLQFPISVCRLLNTLRVVRLLWSVHRVIIYLAKPQDSGHRARLTSLSYQPIAIPTLVGWFNTWWLTQVWQSLGVFAVTSASGTLRLALHSTKQLPAAESLPIIYASLLTINSLSVTWITEYDARFVGGTTPQIRYCAW